MFCGSGWRAPLAPCPAVPGRTAARRQAAPVGARAESWAGFASWGICGYWPPVCVAAAGMRSAIRVFFLQVGQQPGARFSYRVRSAGLDERQRVSSRLLGSRSAPVRKLNCTSLPSTRYYSAAWTRLRMVPRCADSGPRCSAGPASVPWRHTSVHQLNSSSGRRSAVVVLRMQVSSTISNSMCNAGASRW